MRSLRTACIALALLACAAPACNDEKRPPVTGANGQQLGGSMTMEEARREVVELRKRGGGPEPESLPPVQSIEETVKVLLADDVYRFQKAIAFVTPLPGADALTLRALLHLARARAFVTSAAILEELARRQTAERDLLASRRESGSADEKRIGEIDAAVRGLTQGAIALRTVGAEDQDTGAKLAAEAQRQRPTDTLALRARIHASALAGEWTIFDREMKGLESQEPDNAEYIRGIEALTRYANPAEAQKHLDAALAKNPDLVGAMALRVLVEREPDARFAALEALRAKSPKHPVVIFAGSTIAKEHELSAGLRNAVK